MRTALSQLMIAGVVTGFLLADSAEIRAQGFRRNAVRTSPPRPAAPTAFNPRFGPAFVPNNQSFPMWDFRNSPSVFAAGANPQGFARFPNGNGAGMMLPNPFFANRNAQPSAGPAWDRANFQLPQSNFTLATNPAAIPVSPQASPMNLGNGFNHVHQGSPSPNAAQWGNQRRGNQANSLAYRIPVQTSASPPTNGMPRNNWAWFDYNSAARSANPLSGTPALLHYSPTAGWHLHARTSMNGSGNSFGFRIPVQTSANPPSNGMPRSNWAWFDYNPGAGTANPLSGQLAPLHYSQTNGWHLHARTSMPNGNGSGNSVGFRIPVQTSASPPSNGTPRNNWAWFDYNPGAGTANPLSGTPAPLHYSSTAGWHLHARASMPNDNGSGNSFGFRIPVQTSASPPTNGTARNWAWFDYNPGAGTANPLSGTPAPLHYTSTTGWHLHARTQAPGNNGGFFNYQP
jgi:hypothetical protein